MMLFEEEHTMPEKVKDQLIEQLMKTLEMNREAAEIEYERMYSIPPPLQKGW